MNKKTAKIGVALGVSSILALTSAYAAMADSSGYEAYKSAFKQTHSAKSFTGSFNVTVSDNGKPVLELTSASKFNKESHQSSSSITLKDEDQSQSIAVYHLTDKAVFKSSTSDVYNVVEMKNGEHQKWNHRDDNSERQQDIENVVDTLLQNFDSYITMDNNSDGSKEIALRLSEDQIPATANAIGSMLIKSASTHHNTHAGANHQQNPLFGDVANFHADVPKLTTDIKIKKVDVQAEVNKDNYIDSQQADIVVSGKDAAGVTHEVNIHVNADLSGFNNTTVDSIDLTGKQVNTIKREDMMAHKGHH